MLSNPGPSTLYDCPSSTSDKSNAPSLASSRLGTREFWKKLSNIVEAFGKAGPASCGIDEKELIECQAVVNEVVAGYDMLDSFEPGQSNVQEDVQLGGYCGDTPPATPTQSNDTLESAKSTISFFDEFFLDAEDIMTIVSDNSETCSLISGISEILQSDEPDVDVLESFCDQLEPEDVEEELHIDSSVEEDCRGVEVEVVERSSGDMEEGAHNTCTGPFRQRKSRGAGLKKLPVQPRKNPKKRHASPEKESSASPEMDTSKRYYFRVRKPAQAQVETSSESLPKPSRPLDLSIYGLKPLSVRLVRLNIPLACISSLYALRYCRSRDDDVSSVYGKVRVCETSPMSVAKSWMLNTASQEKEDCKSLTPSKKIKQNPKAKKQSEPSRSGSGTPRAEEERVAVQRSTCSRYNFRKLEIIVSKSGAKATNLTKSMVAIPVSQSPKHSKSTKRASCKASPRIKAMTAVVETENTPAEPEMTSEADVNVFRKEPEMTSETDENVFQVSVPIATVPVMRQVTQDTEATVTAVQQALECSDVDVPDSIKKKALRMHKVLKAMENPYRRDDEVPGKIRKLSLSEKKWDGKCSMAA